MCINRHLYLLVGSTLETKRSQVYKKKVAQESREASIYDVVIAFVNVDMTG